MSIPNEPDCANVDETEFKLHEARDEFEQSCIIGRSSFAVDVQLAFQSRTMLTYLNFVNFDEIIHKVRVCNSGQHCQQSEQS